MLCADFGIEGGRARHNLLTRLQIERAIEADFTSSRGNANRRRLSAYCPHAHGRRLQIYPGLIFGQNDCFGRILRCIDQLFSTFASKSITSRSRRDL